MPTFWGQAEEESPQKTEKEQLEGRQDRREGEGSGTKEEGISPRGERASRRLDRSLGSKAPCPRSKSIHRSFLAVRASLVAQMVKHLPAMRDTQV